VEDMNIINKIVIHSKNEFDLHTYPCFFFSYLLGCSQVQEKKSFSIHDMKKKKKEKEEKRV
jgi:hypothetical protein